MRVLRYRLRQGSGGAGRCPGGEGIERDLLMLEDVTVSLITERRVSRPWGLAGGEPGAPGENWLLPGGDESRAERLPDKCTIRMKAGDVLRMLTPGGGGWGDRREPASVPHAARSSAAMNEHFAGDGELVVADAREEAAVAALERFFDERRESLFFSRQLEVIHESDWFHSITNRALRDVVAADVIRSEVRNLRTSAITWGYGRCCRSHAAQVLG